MRKQKPAVRDIIAGVLLMGAYAGVQIKSPKFSSCVICNEYPRLCFREARVCVDCIHWISNMSEVADLFGLTPQGVANG